MNEILFVSIDNEEYHQSAPARDERVLAIVKKVYGRRNSATVNFFYGSVARIPGEFDAGPRYTWPSIHHDRFPRGRRNTVKWRKLGRLLQAADLIEIRNNKVIKKF